MIYNLPSQSFEEYTLPTGYTRLEYIKSTGTQYINTGILPSTSQNWYIDMALTTTYTTSDDACMFGSYVQGGIRYHFGWAVPGYIDRYSFLGSIPSANNRFTYSFVNGVLNDGVTTTDLTTATTATFTLNSYLFARNTDGTANNFINAILYGMTIYENNVLSHNYIPCLNASNEAGMYDLVTQTFFGNDGTGTFTAGEPV